VRKQTNVYIFGFAIAICLFASVVLAVASTALKPAQSQQVRLDIIQNILSVAGITAADLKGKTPAQVIDLYEENFEVLLIDKDNAPVAREEMEQALQPLGYKDSELAELMTFELLEVYNAKLKLLARRAGESLEEYDRGIKVLYIYQPGGELKSYILPIEGNGLWGMMYGYFALKPDLNTVAGIRFYKHIETPGLGAELAKPEHNEKWIGKEILDEDGKLISVQIVKGKVEESHPNEPEHYVDGISGATITAQGINEFLLADLKTYEPYFKTRRAQLEMDETAGVEQ
jgi:Na+-transporting NADH:ubiquinone oxidoreductase subunit C